MEGEEVCGRRPTVLPVQVSLRSHSDSSVFSVVGNLVLHLPASAEPGFYTLRGA